MNDRERMLAVLDGRSPDRIPWVPRILLWYDARRLSNTMPKRFEGMSLREVERALRVGTPARDGYVHHTELRDVEVVQRDQDGKRIIEYHTPIGTVRSVTGFTPDLDAMGLPGRVHEFLLKTPADYRVWEFVVEHTEYVADYDAYRAYDAEIGDEGLPMVSAGDVPFHYFAQHLAGYEHAYLQLVDHTKEVEHLLALMEEVDRAKLWPVIANSPARSILHGLHLSSQFTPPHMFETYVMPYYQGFNVLMHEHGKSVAMHADNDTSAIMDQIERAGWDVLECFVTAPMVPLTMRKARETWGTRVILWGGIPSLIMSKSYSEDDFRAYMNDLFDAIAPGDAIILGVADNVMPDSLIDRVAWISDLVEERGQYPING